MDATVHERHKRRAIEIARGNPDAPFGTVIADKKTGEVLAEGLNDAEKNPILHGEIDAILNLAGTHPNADWTRLVLYTTAEPCLMYSGAILWCGIPHVVFGSSIATLERLDLPQISLYCGEIARRASSFFAHPEITGGCLKESATLSLRRWLGGWAREQEYRACAVIPMLFAGPCLCRCNLRTPQRLAKFVEIGAKGSVARIR